MEREHGKAAWLRGATFVSEGAIPFAAADPPHHPLDDAGLGRPAGLLAAEAAKQPVPVTIDKEGDEAVDVRSILSVLTLDVRHGDEVVLTSNAALDAVDALLQIDHDG